MESPNEPFISRISSIISTKKRLKLYSDSVLTAGEPLGDQEERDEEIVLSNGE